MALMQRKDVPQELKWDLTHIYATKEDFEKDIIEVERKAKSIAETYRGTLTDGEHVVACLKAHEEYRIVAGSVMDYASLAASVDYTDAVLQGDNGRVQRLMADCESELSFIKDELMALELSQIEALCKENERYSIYLQSILREKPYALTPETEMVLKALAPVLEAPNDIYHAAKLADIRFDNFQVGEEEYPLGYSMFEDHYEYLPQTEVRRAACDSFYGKIKEYANVTAQAYNTRVQYEKKMSELRGFDSVFDYLLFPQRVDKSLYDRQIDCIMEQLAPHMRKYAALLKKVHKLDRMTYADLKLPLDPEFSMEVTREKAMDYVKNALHVMGEDYGNMVERVFSENRIDYAQNEGKSTGGFCESVYRNGSYILLTWQGNMADVFTIAHEVGHAGHFYLADQNQTMFDREVSTYLLEAPSTINELLLANYLMTASTDKRFRRFVLASMIGNTYYHNFVTHLLEAAYQREVYRIVDAGGSVSAESLSKIYKEVLCKFWGDEVELTKGCELTWMRQPHYYYGLYSYTYSAGLTVATEVSRRITKEGQPAVEDWLKTLSLGGALPPEELARIAGVDISTDTALKNTIETIGNIIDEIEKLTEEL